MAKIINFKKKDLSNNFVQSLTEEQKDIFLDLLIQIEDCYENLKQKYLEKSAECEILKAENTILKGI